MISLGGDTAAFFMINDGTNLEQSWTGSHKSEDL
jgi:hypothetical protein